MTVYQYIPLKVLGILEKELEILKHLPDEQIFLFLVTNTIKLPIRKSGTFTSTITMLNPDIYCVDA